MTNIDLTPSPASITDAAMRLQYDDITTRAELLNFALAFADDTIILKSDDIRRALSDAIDCDLNDMLHNMNLDFYLPLSDLDTLTDDQTESLAEHLYTHTCADLIADALLAKLPA